MDCGRRPVESRAASCECSVNIRAFDDSVLQNALDAILSLGKGQLPCAQ